MSFDKAIEHHKEHRKPYYGAKAIDCTCRNHGSCTVCEGNRLYQRRKTEEASLQRIAEVQESIKDEI